MVEIFCKLSTRGILVPDGLWAKKNCVVPSSAKVEDLTDARFSGQHHIFLNITKKKAPLEAVKKYVAFLYLNRAIKYHDDEVFKHNEAAL